MYTLPVNVCANLFAHTPLCTDLLANNGETSLHIEGLGFRTHIVYIYIHTLCVCVCVCVCVCIYTYIYLYLHIIYNIYIYIYTYIYI